MLDNKNIRNISIIAHVDHGKSTLADRLIEMSGLIKPGEHLDQILDNMELEREKGITIKSQPIRLKFDKATLNLIDTPGHVDFSYEVSRALPEADVCSWRAGAAHAVCVCDEDGRGTLGDHAPRAGHRVPMLRCCRGTGWAAQQRRKPAPFVGPRAGHRPVG